MRTRRKELFAGAVIVFIIALWMVNVMEDIFINRGLAFPFELSLSVVKAFTWFETVGVLVIVIFALLDYGRKKPKIMKLSPRYDLKVRIPGYFLIALLPVGMAFIILGLGQDEWGLYLACVSFPALLGFLVIALRKAG